MHSRDYDHNTGIADFSSLPTLLSSSLDNRPNFLGLNYPVSKSADITLSRLNYLGYPNTLLSDPSCSIASHGKPTPILTPNQSFRFAVDRSLVLAHLSSLFAFLLYIFP